MSIFCSYSVFLIDPPLLILNNTHNTHHYPLVLRPPLPLSSPRLPPPPLTPLPTGAPTHYHLHPRRIYLVMHIPPSQLVQQRIHMQTARDICGETIPAPAAAAAALTPDQSLRSPTASWNSPPPPPHPLALAPVFLHRRGYGPRAKVEGTARKVEAGAY